MSLIQNIHYIISLFIVFGFLFNNSNMLKIHLIFNIIVILHWLTNNNKCFLSELEYNEENQDNGYIIDIVYNISGIRINKSTGEILAYLSVIIPGYLSYVKINSMNY